jgi:hypothetical protein
MRNIVNEDGEIIANATDDHTLVGGHHRLAVAASLGQKLFWKDTGEPVKLDPFFKGSTHRHNAWCAGNVTRLAERLVKADHVDAAEFMHLMTVGGFSATAPRAPGAPALLAGFFALSHTFDGRRGSMKPEGRRRWTMAGG